MNYFNKHRFLSLITALFMLVSTGCHTASRPAATLSTPDSSSYTFRTASPDGIGKFYFGREISHIMGATGSAWLERDERQEEESTNLAIENIPVPPGAVIADIGAGTGYYTFRISDKPGIKKLYAVDVQDEMIDFLKARKEMIGDTIVEVIKGTETSPNLPEAAVDLAIMVDVYHELKFPAEMLRAIHRSLKPKGRVLLIEYRGEDPSVPIKPLHKTTIAQLNKELEANGFVPDEQKDFLPLQHFVFYRKQ